MPPRIQSTLERIEILVRLLVERAAYETCELLLNELVRKQRFGKPFSTRHKPDRVVQLAHYRQLQKRHRRRVVGLDRRWNLHQQRRWGIDTCAAVTQRFQDPRLAHPIHAIQHNQAWIERKVEIRERLKAPKNCAQYDRRGHIHVLTTRVLGFEDRIEVHTRTLLRVTGTSRGLLAGIIIAAGVGFARGGRARGRVMTGRLDVDLLDLPGRPLLVVLELQNPI